MKKYSLYLIFAALALFAAGCTDEWEKESPEDEEVEEVGSEEGSTNKPSTIKYSELEGSGSEDDPYLISSPGDVLILLSYLLEDPVHGYGYYFRQTRPIELPRRSQVIDGRMWVAATFSGNYDGGGYRLHNLVYQGASDKDTDCGIGLFKELHSATVKNLTLSDALITNIVDDAGILAGKSSGDCLVENVTVSGNIIASGSNLGGLIGSAKDKMTLRNITVKSLTVNTDETSGSNLGALIGYHENGDLIIDGVSTPDHIFSISGGNNVGGVVGKVYAPGKSVSISNVALQHSVDTESSMVRIIHGATNVGGLAGHLSEIDRLILSGNQVKAPVSGDSNVGGMAGYCSNPTRVSVESCQLMSVVDGGESVGGFFGHMNNHTGGRLEFKGTDNGSRLVVKSSAAAEVAGDINVGGLIGYLDAHKGSVNVDSKVEIALNVSGRDRVGGAVGAGYNATLNSTQNLNFSSPTMKVTATEKCAGGVMGYGEKVTINGDNSLDPVAGTPSAGLLTHTFQGVVTGLTEAGCIIGVLIDGTVKGMSSAGHATARTSCAGGVAGKAVGTITECAFNGSLSCPENQGGIVGFATDCDLTISKCVNYATLSDARRLGGILGEYQAADNDRRVIFKVRISQCFNLGDIHNGLDAAGIVAHMEYSDCVNFADNTIHIEECGNSGKITGNDNSGQYAVGGIAGTLNCMQVKVKGCANLGSITSSGVQKSVGGVVGRAGCENALVVYVQECMNIGTISSDASSVKLGGIVGHQENSLALGDASRVWNCYNLGAIPGDQKDDTGGIVGYVARFTDISYNYNQGEISHGNAIIGTHKTGTTFSHKENYFLKGSGGNWPSATAISEKQKLQESTFKGFDFKNIWIMNSNLGPRLRNCPFQAI